MSHRAEQVKRAIAFADTPVFHSSGEELVRIVCFSIKTSGKPRRTQGMRLVGLRIVDSTYLQVVPSLRIRDFVHVRDRGVQQQQGVYQGSVTRR